MSDHDVITTTRSEDFAPLGFKGRPLTSRYSNLVAELKRIDPRYQSLFAIPFEQEDGHVSWSKPGGFDRAVRLSDLPRHQQRDAQSELLVMTKKIERYAEDLSKPEDSTQDVSTGDLDASELLLKALNILDEEHLWLVDDALLITGWGQVKKGASAERAVLKALGARHAAEETEPAPEPQNDPIPLGNLGQSRSGNHASTSTYAPDFAPTTSNTWATRSNQEVLKPGFPWLAALLWLLTVLFLALIFWRLLANCALGWPGAQGLSQLIANFCPVIESVEEENADINAGLEDRLHQLHLQILRDREQCIRPQDDPALIPPAVEAPEPDEAPEIIPEEQIETAPEAEEIIDDVIREGGEIGNVNIVLRWSNNDDLDLIVRCPGNGSISYSSPSACGGRLDVDMNYGGRFSEQPVENIVFSDDTAPPGQYQIMVRRSRDNTPASPKTDFTVDLIVDGQRIDRRSGSTGLIEEVMQFELPTPAR